MRSRAYYSIAELLLCFLLLLLVTTCEPGPPTGPEIEFQDRLVASCIIDPAKETLFVFISKLSETSMYDLEHPPEDEANNEFGDYYSVSGAMVRIIVDSDTILAREDSLVDWEDYWEKRVYHRYYYVFQGPEVKPGQTWELTVSHPDYESLYGKTVIPDSVSFEDSLIDTLTIWDKYLTFKWKRAENAEGYLCRLHLTSVRYDGSRERTLIPYGWDPVERYATEEQVQRSTTITYSIHNFMEWVRELGESHFDNMESYKEFYLRLTVYSLDRAYYYSLLWGNSLDELSSFDNPYHFYSNIEGGWGIFGSYWITVSPKVYVSKDLIIQALEERTDR